MKTLFCIIVFIQALSVMARAEQINPQEFAGNYRPVKMVLKERGMSRVVITDQGKMDLKEIEVMANHETLKLMVVAHKDSTKVGKHMEMFRPFWHINDGPRADRWGWAWSGENDLYYAKSKSRKVKLYDRDKDMLFFTRLDYRKVKQKVWFDKDGDLCIKRTAKGTERDGKFFVKFEKIN